MEVHGFLLGVHMNHPTQVIVVRGISDLVDDRGEAIDETWQPIAARYAAAFAFQILAKYTGPNEGGAALSRWTGIEPHCPQRLAPHGDANAMSTEWYSGRSLDSSSLGACRRSTTG
jgi:hypothetical protein